MTHSTRLVRLRSPQAGQARQLPPKPSLEHLRNQAKDLHKAHKKGDPSCCEALRHLTQFKNKSDADILAAGVGLQDVQFAIAMEYGFETWQAMKAHVEGAAATPAQLANKRKTQLLVDAFNRKDAAAARKLFAPDCIHHRDFGPTTTDQAFLDEVLAVITERYRDAVVAVTSSRAGEHTIIAEFSLACPGRGSTEQPSGLARLTFRDGLIVENCTETRDPKHESAGEYAHAPGEALRVRGNEEMVSMMAEMGQSDASVDREGFTALHWAALSGNTAVVKKLVAEGVEVNAPDKDGCTPLLHAAAFCEKEAVEALIAAGADIGPNTAGLAPLQAAANYGRSANVETLLAHGANPNAATVSGGQTPLFFAAEFGDAGIVERLLAAGADVHARTRKGSTALHAAADRLPADVDTPEDMKQLATATRDAHYDPSDDAANSIVAVLLDHGADINARDENGLTPLGCARHRGRRGTVDFLLCRGATE